jgi:hypothetical protein
VVLLYSDCAPGEDYFLQTADGKMPVCGTTEVMPCYKTLSEWSFSAACETPASLRIEFFRRL